MSNIKFSELPDQGLPTDSTIIPTVDSGINYTVTGANLKTYVNSTTGNVVAGNVSATGNVSGTYIFGDGSFLTGLPEVYGNANVSNYLASGTNLANIVSQGNISGDYIIADGSALTNLELGPYLVAYTGNLAGGNVSVTGNVIGSYLLGNIRNATGGYSDSNVQSVLQSYSGSFTAATVSATGNITGSYILGNGSQLTGIAASYGNANVAAFLPTYTGALTGANLSVVGNVVGGNVSTTGNVTGAYIKGDGSQLSNLPAGTLAGNMTGNILGNGFAITGVTTLTSTGNISTTGNVVGIHFGNGANLTGIPTSIVAGTGISVSAATGAVTITNNNPTPYTNANVATLLTSFGANPISTTGNISGGNLIGTHVGSGSQLTGIVTSIIAGSGISINQSTGAVTVTAAGSGSFVDLTSNQTITGNKTFTGTTQLGPYIEYTAYVVNSGTSFTPTMSNGPVQRVVANNNFTLNAPSGMVAGQSITLVIIQDATGSRIMTANSSYKFAYGLKFLSTTPNAIDMMSIFYDGSNYLCNLVKGYS